ncbi:bifunctional DNA primase/polymerase [Frigoriglobus tundricola]|uniref:DNA primase/polymerase bifunctional N-terminal domain-containing protein n=1 Tax=Frigoriglobus tundricola TaxID=2774151 RepID=A0A6M5YET1_9BACT|nr:bifunctional DNA primase/polymerase [Frigoriglobus tundricola]QJW92517.1 hypothetical protein FTUN_0013 [Frigoriglobus tundricola]
MADKPAMAGPERLYAAIRYAEKHGFFILPDHTVVDGCCTCGHKDCDRPGKHPLTKNGVKDASDDLVIITNWWVETGNKANVGIATGAASKLVVLDIDVKGGGIETLALWKQEHGEMPKTPAVRTPTGGLHFYFRYADGVGSKTGIAPGIDVRGNGGQVVAPPSIHMCGGKYEWIEPLTTPLAEMPAWLLDLILKPKAKEALKVEAPVVAAANPMIMTLSIGSLDLRTSPGAGEGQRHDTLCKLVGVQLARGDREINVLEDALGWAETCEPPMEMSEVVRTVKSLATKHVSQTTITPTIPATVADDVESASLPEPPPWPMLESAARHGTRAIHALQRRRETLEGMLAAQAHNQTLALHRNAQRLLRPLLVVNPFAERLTFLDARTRTRRDHQKYLTLIRTVTLLHQHQRSVRTVEHQGKNIEFIEVTLDDIERANELAADVLGRSLDELPPQTRRLLCSLDTMVRAACETEEIDRGEFRFSRRDVRNFTGWGDTQLKLHLKRLVDLEYLLAHHDREARRHMYELLYVPSGTDRAVPGLIDVAVLRRGPTTGDGGDRSGSEPHRSGVNGDRSGDGRPTVGPRSPAGRGEEPVQKPRKPSGKPRSRVKIPKPANTLSKNGKPAS